MIAGSTAAIAAPLVYSTTFAQAQSGKLTVLFDAFGKPSGLKRGWGYAALIEYGGRRVLFDTGSRGSDFVHNVNSLGVDLKGLDFVVISHRHNDHTGGLHHVLQQNPEVPIYTPVEGAGFNSLSPAGLIAMMRRKVPTVPEELQYFGGNPPSENRSDSPWPNARFSQITQPTEVLPGFFILSTRSARPGTIEMNEVSLVVKTPKGSVIVVGCSHPGVENIIDAAAKIDPNIHSVFGGFHLVDIPDEKVSELVLSFRDKWRIERVSAGHCTGQFAFAEMLRVYGDKFDLAGVGTVIPLPT